MTLIDPVITEPFNRCGAVGVSDEESDDDYLRWIDGFNQCSPNESNYQRPLAQIGSNGFRGCRRDQFLEELAKEIPQGVIEFRKRVETLHQKEDGTLILDFVDGTKAEAEAGKSPFFSDIISDTVLFFAYYCAYGWNLAKNCSCSNQ